MTAGRNSMFFIGNTMNALKITFLTFLVKEKKKMVPMIFLLGCAALNAANQLVVKD
jgi:hypothetical protein